MYFVLMYARNLPLPKTSFFLFGPRSTGKTTWLMKALPQAKWFNLLLDQDYLTLSADPSSFQKSVENLKSGSWIVIDEIQKLPSLLNSVHYLLTKYPNKYNFALSGSSARKLKRLETNLLAGRVIEKNFFPLTANELGKQFDVEKVLDTGLLPLIWTDQDLSKERLLSYVNTYLKQEIQQEALVSDVPAFSRFLRVASILNGTTLNYANVARDAQVKRKVAEHFFSVLVDTLIAFYLPAWQPKATVKEVAKPKFYFFDCGVVRACANRLGASLGVEEQGFLFETYILHELRAYMNSSATFGELSYWQSSAGNEVDVIWSLADKHIGIEIKSSKTWKSKFNNGLKHLLEQDKIKKAYGVYLGSHSEKHGGIEVLNLNDFLSALYKGELLNF